MKVRVRFAPSPTGYLHIGGLRTALYCYLYARKQGGEYILRIEDTDQNRKVDDAVQRLIEVMTEVGVVHDEGPFLTEDKVIYQKGEHGPYIQSQKLERYKEVADSLVESGHAYYCFCSKERLDFIRDEQKRNDETSRYDGLCRNIDLEEAKNRIANGEKYVIRLKLPSNYDLSFYDYVRGEVTFNTNDLDDQVLIKQDGFPTYHMAVVVDDHDMEITHVMRGEEWLSSTPKHVYLYECLGWQKPEYVHLPLILNANKKKLSKRQDDVAVEDFLKKGYLKEALLNYVSLVGWSPDDSTEIMSLDMIVEKFSLERLSKSSAVFDTDKLKWMNSQYIKNYDEMKLYELCKAYFIENGIVSEEEYGKKADWLLMIIRALKERVEVITEFATKAKVFVSDDFEVEEEASAVLLEETAPTVLNEFKAQVAALEEIDSSNVKDIMKTVQKNTGIKGKALFMPIRAKLAGTLHGVDMNDMLMIMGKDRILSRLNK